MKYFLFKFQFFIVEVAAPGDMNIHSNQIIHNLV